jgi:hypothetical protein
VPEDSLSDSIRSLARSAVECVRTLWREIKRHTAAVIIAAIAVAALVLSIIALTKGHTPQKTARVDPNEYMYLDTARVDSYLGQLKDGDVKGEKVEETSSESSGFGLEVDEVGKANTSRGIQVVKSVVVTRSEADRFYDLLVALKTDHSIIERDADDECSVGGKLDPTAAPTGTIILIKNATVQMPPFLAAYPELRYAGYRLLANETPAEEAKHETESRRHWVNEEVFGRVPLTQFQTIDDATKPTPREERRSFQERVGKNPRVPFSFSVPADRHDVEMCEKRAHGPKEHAARRVTVVLPARFANLTGDPSLLSAPLTIVGMVVTNTGDNGDFGDGTSITTYWPALRSARARFLRELGVREEFLRLQCGKRRGCVGLRRHLFGAMERSLTYRGHVVEILPIAMYDSAADVPGEVPGH